MRALVNRYFDWVWEDDADSFGQIGRFLSLFVVAATAIVVVVLAIGFIIALIAMIAGVNLDQGSCKIQHYNVATKTYVCDEYYPPPTTQP